MKLFNLTLGLAAAAALAAPLSAQGRNSVGIPPGQMPPAGMCRIWIDGVPPGHQPRPTDCVTAQRNVPVNGRVIYGSNTGNGGKYGRNGGGVYGNNNGVYDRNGDGVIDSRDQVGTNCHWYDINCTSTAASNEGWTPIGRDRSGNAIYERRRTDRNGNVMVQRARRDSNGRFVIISRDTQGRNSRGVIQNRNDRRDEDNNGVDDRYENQTNIRNNQVYDAAKGNGKGQGNGKYKDKGNKKH